MTLISSDLLTAGALLSLGFANYQLLTTNG
jgi:hypothetical protein